MSREIKVKTARDLGPQFVNNPHRMVGQDGAFSFPLPDGSSFWYFGDTLIGERPKGCSPWMIDGKMVDHRDMSGQGPYEQMINNTGLMLPRQSGANGLRDFKYITDSSGKLKNLLPLEGDEHPDWDRIWCQGGIALSDRIVLSFIQVRMVEKYDGPLPIGFEIVGSGLATANYRRPVDYASEDFVPWHAFPHIRPPYIGGESASATLKAAELKFERVRNGVSHILWGASEPHFGCVFTSNALSPMNGDQHLYIYGTVNLPGGHKAFLARVMPSRVEVHSDYKYFAGMGSDELPCWSRSLSDAIPLFGNMPSEMSVSFNAHLNCYLAVHSFDLTGQIVARTAPNPWGPWSEPTVLWQVQPTPLDYELPYPFRLIYAGKEHPQLSPDGGKTIYLTYIEFEEYFPHLVEVEFF